MKSSAPNHHCNLVVSALGVVFGDIGTSPLYAFQAALNAFGVLSRNMSYAPIYFPIPYTQIVDFTWMMQA